MRRLAGVLALLLMTAPAGALAATPYELYRDGHFQAAIEAGLAQNDAEGLSQAAHAEMAIAHMADKPCMDCLKKAEDYARKAIAADPKLAAPHVYLAASLGYQARIIGVFQAKMKGYAQTAKDELDAALKYHPQDHYALAAMGGWNIGIVNGGGAMLAHMMYGASVAQGLDYYEKAMKAAPGNIVIRFQYALSLSAYNRDNYAKEIQGALTIAATGTARTAYERFMQGQAKQLLALYRKADWDAYGKLMHKIQGYPD